MAEPFSAELRGLLTASNLGLSAAHPLAGWVVLTILYQEGSNASEAMTLGYLLRRYNNVYLELDEKPMTDAILRRVLEVLGDQANLVESSPRKIRIHLHNGGTSIQQSWTYKITSGGIEYWTAMQKVLDAESTVAVNISRIDEYCQMVQKLVRRDYETSTTQLYNDFTHLLTAYDDVMKGMHKLDEDLSELANDLSFNHGSEAAALLHKMLTQKAIPAFEKLLMQTTAIQHLSDSDSFSAQVARSQQGSDDLDASHAVQDQAKMNLRKDKTATFATRQLTRLAASFDPSASAIDSSADTVYILFQTIKEAIDLLSQEYDHIQGQSVDVKALTGQIDRLLTHYQSVRIAPSFRQHLALDRPIDDVGDLLEASTIGAVAYSATTTQRVVATNDDNPEIGDASNVDTDQKTAGLKEFQKLIMKDSTHGVVNTDLEFQTRLARDEVVRLASAVYYHHYESFALFGRAIDRVTTLGQQPIALHLDGEEYHASLPNGFEFWFAEAEVRNG